jgi:hypothetical protein
VDLEAARAERWAVADKALAEVLLLGPRPVRHDLSRLGARHRDGYIDDDGGLTIAGWWRLAFLAGQGVGPTECFRQERLRVPRVRRHLRLVQALCLAEMAEHGSIPLGAEYSATGIILGSSFHGVRADALLRDPDGSLVWVEVMRRELRRASGNALLKYKLLETDVLPQVADRLRRRVRFVLRLPSGTVRKEFRPLGGTGW